MSARNRDATATIASGASLSAPVHIGVGNLVAIQMPSAWTAANLTFQLSGDGGATYQNAYDASGNEVVITAAAGQTIPLNQSDFAGWAFFKVRSGTSGTPVNQAAARSVLCLNRVQG